VLSDKEVELERLHEILTKSAAAIQGALQVSVSLKNTQLHTV